MPQDTLKNRISKEAAQFPEIYNYFKNQLEQTQKRICDSELEGELLPEWAYLFEMPFRDGGMASPDSDVPYEAVVKTIRALGLHRMRSGAVRTNDLRTLRVDDIEPEVLAAQYNLSESEQRKRGLTPIKRDFVDYDDPIFWRTLIEVFCRAFVSSAHGVRPWPLKRRVSLAIDLIDIHNEKLKGRWSIKEACAILEKEPYGTRYETASSSESRQRSVGEDRVRSVVKTLIGGMRVIGGTTPLDRLRSKFPREYEEVLQERERPKTVEEAQTLLDSNTYPAVNRHAAD